MKPAPFDYLRAASAEEALATLAEHGDEARILAGGQSLMPMLNMRLLQPRIIVDVSAIAELRKIDARDGHLAVGASVTQSGLMASPGLATRSPLLASALPWVGHFQTRNRGTVCGSVAHADPSAEIPLCLVALEGEVVLRSTRRRRTVAAETFFIGPLTTVRNPDEMIESVRFRLPKPGAGYAFREVAMRHGDFRDHRLRRRGRRQRHPSLAVGGVADRPVAKNWPLLKDDALDDALNAFAWELGGDDDQHATARYRRDLVRRVGRLVIEEARSCQA